MQHSTENRQIPVKTSVASVKQPLLRSTKIDEWSLADKHVHAVDMSNVNVSMNKDRTGAETRQ